MKACVVPILFFVLFSLTLSLGGHALAASYFPSGLNPEEEIEAGSVTQGETAYMFSSGTSDVRRAIAVDDLLNVYRENGFSQKHQVATIRVLSDAGENYYRIMVVDGEIRYGDVARKGEASCLIVLHRVRP